MKYLFVIISIPRIGIPPTHEINWLQQALEPVNRKALASLTNLSKLFNP